MSWRLTLDKEGKVKRVIFWVVILGSVLVTPAFAVIYTVSWEQVTTYTDNTLIEPEKTVYYDITKRTQGGIDNVMIVPNTTAISGTFDQANDGKVYVFNGRARLNTGEESEWSPDVLWTAPPPGTLPGTPVQPIILQISRP
jgi:hypothetical protein